MIGLRRNVIQVRQALFGSDPHTRDDVCVLAASPGLGPVDLDRIAGGCRTHGDGAAGRHDLLLRAWSIEEQTYICWVVGQARDHAGRPSLRWRALVLGRDDYRVCPDPFAWSSAAGPASLMRPCSKLPALELASPPRRPLEPAVGPEPTEELLLACLERGQRLVLVTARSLVELLRGFLARLPAELACDVALAHGGAGLPAGRPAGWPYHCIVLAPSAACRLDPGAEVRLAGDPPFPPARPGAACPSPRLLGAGAGHVSALGGATLVERFASWRRHVKLSEIGKRVAAGELDLATSYLATAAQLGVAPGPCRALVLDAADNQLRCPGGPTPAALALPDLPPDRALARLAHEFCGPLIELASSAAAPATGRRRLFDWLHHTLGWPRLQQELERLDTDCLLRLAALDLWQPLRVPILRRGARVYAGLLERLRHARPDLAAALLQCARDQLAAEGIWTGARPRRVDRAFAGTALLALALAAACWFIWALGP